MTLQRKPIDGVVITCVELDGTEQPPLAISRVTKLAADACTPGRIYIEQAEDGSWRLTYTSSTIPDLSALTALRLVADGTQKAPPGQ